MGVKWISGLWRWVSVAAVVSLAVTAAALIIALAAAGTAGSAGGELSDRLLPATAASAVLLADYLDEQMVLRNYVTSAQPSALRQYRQVSAEIPGQQEKVATLVSGYPHMPGKLAAASAAWRVWLARVAGPQLRATAQGDSGRARVLQANIMSTRPYTLAIRLPVAALQAQLASVQTRLTARLVSAQGRVIAALAAVCVMVAVIAVGGVVAVRRWLLAPFSALRTAAESVAAGRYETRIPTVGPAELADLGRSTELMRTRLAAALADARRAEERFRGLFHSSPDATLTVAADGSIVMVNAQAERMFGYSFGELAGRPVELLVPAAARAAHPGRRAAYFADPRSRQMGEGLELSAVRKDGQEFRVEVSLSSLPGETGVVASVTVRDISDRLAAQAEAERLRAATERERVERRRQQSERVQDLSELLSGFTRDFNDLLNVITGYTDLIGEQVRDLPAEDSRLAVLLADVEQVRDGAQRATKLTRQLLILARRDIVQPEVLELGSVVGGIEQVLRGRLGEHVDLIIVPSNGLWPVRADRSQIERVVTSLTINGRDAMPDGGKLTLDTGNIVADETYAASRPDLRPGRYVRLRVSDTGTGMTREALAHAFEPSHPTWPQDQDAGPGLATVHDIVTQAGGCAHIYSEPGLGTTVTALLPAADLLEAGPGPAAALRRGRGEKILLIEDEPSLWQLASRILTRNGYQVCDGATAADALREAGDPQRPIDLLLTDAIMPDMLGTEVAARVRVLRPGLPVLYMSGYAQAVLDADGALGPNVDFMEKPFSEAEIVARVRRAIDGAEPGGPDGTNG
jgi:PAS domain S-box-containing protein